MSPNKRPHTPAGDRRRTSRPAAKPRRQQRRLPADRRRALILEAAGQRFGERGYTATRLDDVATAAGVTKPILYRHFDSKKALYLALLAEHHDALPTFAEHPAGQSPEARLRALLDTWLAYVQEHGYAWKMLFRDTGGGDEINAFRQTVQTRAHEVMAEMIESEPAISAAPHDVEPLAEFLRAGGAGLALWWLDHPNVPRSALLDTLLRVSRGLT